MSSPYILAHAKINLFLHVTGKRDDGYHLLESLVTFAEFGDRLELKPAETLSLEITGPFAASLSQDNIVMKAAQLLKNHTGYKAGAQMTLEKHIPVGAGLGGGSSDAAAALLGLAKLWGVAIDDADMQKMALQLGADVPVCLARRMAWMQGVGERVTPIKRKCDVWAVLVNPGAPLLTKDVFRRFSGAFTPPADMPKEIDSFDALMRCIQPKHNMLETPAMALAPVIRDVLVAIGATPGCYLSRMSGSGATCFGLYDNEATAKAAAADIQRRFPQWWSRATRL